MINPMIPTVLTAAGLLTNTSFFESDLINVVKAENEIKAIKCNYGEVYADGYNLITIEPTIRRGRKPKNKKETSRKKQGTGKCFNSQISFHIILPSNPTKTYKIKVFRNGAIIAPGGLLPSMEDIKLAIQPIARLLSSCFVEDVHLINLRAVMRNYKFRLSDERYMINMDAMYKIFTDNHTTNPLFKDIVEIKYNVERNPKLNIKFITAIYKKTNPAMKIYRSGKINIDNALSEENAKLYYDWITAFFEKYKREILYIPRVEESSSEDSDS